MELVKKIQKFNLNSTVHYHAVRYSFIIAGHLFIISEFEKKKFLFNQTCKKD